MSEQPVVVSKVSWNELCSWSIIFKTLPVAASMSVLALALLGVVASPVGWWISQAAFIGDDLRTDNELMEIVESNNSPWRGVFLMGDVDDPGVEVMGTRLSGPRAVFDQLTKPFIYLFQNRSSRVDADNENASWGGWVFSYFFCGCVWTIVVWSFIGIGIARVCALRLTRNEFSGIDDAFDFTLDHWMTGASAVAIPLLAVLVLCIPAGLLGLLMTFDFGVAIVGLLWFVVLALATAMAVLLAGVLFGWPLMIASVGIEGQNSFDAMTRAFAYTFQRPLNYIGYMIIAILFGGVCWLIVTQLTSGIVGLGYWSTAWGANPFGGGDVPRIEVIQGLVQPMVTVMEDGKPVALVQETSSALNFGQTMIGFWNGLIRTVAAAFIYGLFWCMATAIYLLLRKDVDETEMDEVFVLDETRTYDLPPLKSDAQGIPQVQSPTPVTDSEVGPEGTADSPGN